MALVEAGSELFQAPEDGLAWSKHQVWGPEQTCPCIAALAVLG